MIDTLHQVSRTWARETRGGCRPLRRAAASYEVQQLVESGTQAPQLEVQAPPEQVTRQSQQ